MVSKRNAVLIVVVLVLAGTSVFSLLGTNTQRDESESSEYTTVAQLYEYDWKNYFPLSQHDVITEWYAPLRPVTINSQVYWVSTAGTFESRQQGLSGTPYLPESILKLFVFETSRPWSFWMKDMNYAIDIVWLDESYQVVHLGENVTPESFPAQFVPTLPALYVLETQIGFISTNNVTIGSFIDLSSQIE